MGRRSKTDQQEMKKPPVSHSMTTRSMRRKGGGGGGEGALAMPLPLPKLPTELVEEILTWVPTKPLIQFKSVSKHFNTLLSSNPTFISKQTTRTSPSSSSSSSFQFHNSSSNDSSFILQRYGKSLNEFYYAPNGVFEKSTKLDTSFIGENYGYIVGSANGLICLFRACHSKNASAHSISIWNPATKDYKTLPHPNVQSPSFKVTLAFCFRSNVNDYNVVRLVTSEEVQGDRRIFFIEIEIYSLSTDSWRRVGGFPYNISDSYSRAIMDGVVHWMGNVADSRTKQKLILSFDLNEEVFREVPMPEIECRYSTEYLRMFRGFLSMFVLTCEQIDVWVMKEYGVRESWCKIFSVTKFPTFHHPIEFFKNGDSLLALDQGTNELVSYNSKTGRFKKLGIRKFAKVENIFHMDAVPYVESLVRLTTPDKAR